MYGRKVTFELKANSVNDFKHRQENEILPILRKQRGFQDVITLIEPTKRHVEAISLWTRRKMPKRMTGVVSRKSRNSWRPLPKANRKSR